MKIFKTICIAMMAVFSACSSDDSIDDGFNGSPLKYVSVHVTSDEVAIPNGNVYLFRTEGKKIEDYEPNCWAMEYTPFINYKDNGESSFLLPISGYGKKYKGDLLLDEENGYSIETIYWNNLSNMYGIPKPGDEYVIVVMLRNGAGAKAYKRLKINRSSIIRVHLPAYKLGESTMVDAEWTVTEVE